MSGGAEPRALTSSASAHLDLIRGVAAWAVMWDHARSLFFVGYRQLENKTPSLSILYFVTGFGPEAVKVFFVLSGFLISSAILSRRASGNWSWRDYAIDRSSRLYAVLIPALVLGLLWDTAGSSRFAFKDIYAQALEGVGAGVIRSRLTFGNFVGNLFFLQTIVCPVFGSNAPLWSLANEFWYYVLFPLALSTGIAWKRKSIRPATLLTIATLGVAVFVGRTILIAFLIWLAGTALVFAYSKLQFSTRGRLLLYIAISCLPLFICLAAARSRHLGWLGSDLAVGLAFCAFLFGVLQIRVKSDQYSRIAHFLSGFSYSLYALHFPLLVFLTAWLVPSQKWQPDPKHLGIGVALGVATLSFAWLVSISTEGQTHVVRRWMRNVLPRLDSCAR